MDFSDFLNEAYPGVELRHAVSQYSRDLRHAVRRAENHSRYGEAAELEQELRDLNGWYEFIRAGV